MSVSGLIKLVCASQSSKEKKNNRRLACFPIGISKYCINPGPAIILAP